jgi:ribosome assembly protein YihI (activator of Der GTPase)
MCSAILARVSALTKSRHSQSLGTHKDAIHKTPLLELWMLPSEHEVDQLLNQVSHGERLAIERRIDRASVRAITCTNHKKFFLESLVTV